jgi:hypothetical protein
MREHGREMCWGGDGAFGREREGGDAGLISLWKDVESDIGRLFPVWRGS